MGAVADVARMCESLGVRVVRTPGCESRGNGSAWAFIEGIVNHHTAGGNNIYLDQILVDGRWDLSGPLCNYAITYDGDLFIVAEGPANHAGASGGWDTAPMPRTNDFNRRVLGVEVQYKGTEPMSPEQWRTLAVLNYCSMKVLGFNDFVRIKNHNGTSVQGKVDMGKGLDSRGSVITYPIEDVRGAAAAVAAPPKQDDGGLDMATAQEIRGQLAGSDKEGEWPGWPMWRFAAPPNTSVEDWNRGLTMVDMLRSLDRELNSWIDAPRRNRDQRPDKDTLLGHAASAHAAAELLLEGQAKAQATLDQILAAVKK